MTTRAFLLGAAPVLCALAAPAAHAQSANPSPYPTRSIEQIIPWAAGGGVDVVGRAVASAMSDELGQSIVVLNREGAGGTIGFNALAAATPDGYTLGGGPTTPMANAPYLVKGVRYDVSSFDYICQTFENVFALAVRQDSPIKSAEDLVAAAKANPGVLSYGHAGMGTIPHLAAENFAEGRGIKFQQVPFRGDAPMLPILLKGDIDFGSTALASIRGLNLRVLVVFAEKRQANWPDIPTARELGVPDPVPPGFNGVFGPRGLPAHVKQRLEEACAKAVRGPKVTTALTNAGLTATYLPGPEFHERTVADYRYKGALIRRLGLEAR